MLRLVPRGTRARCATLVGAVIALVLAAGSPARAVPEGRAAARASTPASIQLSTNRAAPSQQVTVSGQGYLPGRSVRIVRLPNSDLGSTGVAGDGTFSLTFTVPFDEPDADEQVVVTGTDRNGNFAYLTQPLAIRGTPGSAALDSKNLVSGGQLVVHGRRFTPKYPVRIDFLPVAALGQAQPDANGSFTKTFTLPTGLFPTKYQVVVSGVGMNGRFAYVPIDVQVVTGDVAPAPVATADFSTASDTSSGDEAALPAASGEALPVPVPVDHQDEDILVAILGILLASAIVIVTIVVVRYRRYRRLRA